MNLNALSIVLAFLLACVIVVCYTVLSAMDKPTGVLEQAITGSVVGLIAVAAAVLKTGGTEKL